VHVKTYNRFSSDMKYGMCLQRETSVVYILSLNVHFSMQSMGYNIRFLELSYK